MKTKRGFFKHFAIMLILSACIVTPSLFAHQHWIVLSQANKADNTYKISLCSGHHFPKCGSLASIENTRVFTISPAGKKTKLNLEKSQTTYEATEKGVHIACFEIERGLISKTTKGWKKGGRDKYPKAMKSFKYYSSGTAVISEVTDKHEVKAAGLKFEITGSIQGEEIVLTVYKNGRPENNIKITVASENIKPKEIGTTDRSGKLIYRISKNSPEKLLFTATYRRNTEKGENFDQEVMNSTLYMGLR